MNRNHDLLTAIRRRLALERGFTLIEILIAMALVAIGVAATIGVFGTSSRATVRAQRGEVAVQQAQAEIDRLSTLEYGETALTSAPTASTDPYDPRIRVQSGNRFLVRTGVVEDLVLTPASGMTAMVDPGPTTFSVGSGGAAVTGKIYRFASWRDEQCPTLICDGSENTKRISVAVTLDPAHSNDAPRPPVWLSTIVADPDAVPPGREAPADDEDDGPQSSAQSFYFYDTRCGLTARAAPTASHYTHNTASSGPAPVDNSICEQTDTTKQPDLMGTAPPSSSTTLYDYSADLTGGYPGGLALMRRGTTCRTSYSAADTSNPAQNNKWNVHSWATNPFTSAFNLKGRVTLSMFSTTVGGVSGRGFLCATLLERQIFSGLPSDRVLGTATYDVSNWPSDVRRLTFTFNLSQQETIASGRRLVMALNVRSESAQDLAFLFDHSTYPSLLEVETTTPLP